MKGAWLLALTLLGACEGESADPGLDALLQVGAAQFVTGDLPASTGGPEITAIANPTNQVQPGEVARPLGGSLAPDATAVLIQLVGDRGHWRVVAGAPDVAVPDQPTFSMQLSFARRLARDPIELRLAAVDSDGRVGPAQTVSLGLDGNEADPPALAVVLTWDRDADLDLRVVDPAGIEIFARNPSAAGDDNPGLPPTAEQIARAGRLDLDSNAGCVIDGRRRERVIWSQAAPVGVYTVRVDTPALCDAPHAHWQVEVFRKGVSVGRAEGMSTARDTRFDHGLGAGVFAMSFLQGESPGPQPSGEDRDFERSFEENP